MTQQYFSELLPDLAERAKLSSIGVLGFANIPLQRHLFEVFSRPYGEPSSFLADPTFEAVFGWKKGNYKMQELAGNLLSSALVNAMDNPSKELKKDYRFAKNLKPYLHQIEAWKILSEKEPKSLVVASGTGSGKTECFMVPILDSLIRKSERVKGKQVGVEAIFLYPLNALINSQRDRFRAWTNAFNGDIRFCLYNGNTPEFPEKTSIQNLSTRQ
jgi:DEAD/DEAH box helicase domain-containing protein